MIDAYPLLDSCVHSARRRRDYVPRCSNDITTSPVTITRPIVENQMTTRRTKYPDYGETECDETTPLENVAPRAQYYEFLIDLAYDGLKIVLAYTEHRTRTLDVHFSQLMMSSVSSVNLQTWETGMS